MQINIHFTFVETDNSSAFVHRIRNFAEELERALYNEKIGHVLNMDTATTDVYISCESKRHLGNTSKLITGYLKKHNFIDVANF